MKSESVNSLLEAGDHLNDYTWQSKESAFDDGSIPKSEAWQFNASGP